MNTTIVILLVVAIAAILFAGAMLVALQRGNEKPTPAQKFFKRHGINENDYTG